MRRHTQHVIVIPRFNRASQRLRQRSGVPRRPRGAESGAAAAAARALEAEARRVLDGLFE